MKRIRRRVVNQNITVVDAFDVDRDTAQNACRTRNVRVNDFVRVKAHEFVCFARRADVVGGDEIFIGGNKFIRAAVERQNLTVANAACVDRQAADFRQVNFRRDNLSGRGVVAQETARLDTGSVDFDAVNFLRAAVNVRVNGLIGAEPNQLADFARFADEFFGDIIFIGGLESFLRGVVSQNLTVFDACAVERQTCDFCGGSVNVRVNGFVTAEANQLACRARVGNVAFLKIIVRVGDKHFGLRVVSDSPPVDQRIGIDANAVDFLGTTVDVRRGNNLFRRAVVNQNLTVRHAAQSKFDAAESLNVLVSYAVDDALHCRCT